MGNSVTLSLPLPGSISHPVTHHYMIMPRPKKKKEKALKHNIHKFVKRGQLSIYTFFVSKPRRQADSGFLSIQITKTCHRTD